MAVKKMQGDDHGGPVAPEDLKFRDAFLLGFEGEAHHCGVQGLLGFEIRCSTGVGEVLEDFEICRSRGGFAREGFHKYAHGFVRDWLAIHLRCGAVGTMRVAMKIDAVALNSLGESKRQMALLHGGRIEIFEFAGRWYSRCHKVPDEKDPRCRGEMLMGPLVKPPWQTPKGWRRTGSGQQKP